MKTSPRPALAYVAWALYVAIFIGLFAALGVDYDDVGDTAENALKAIVIPVGAAVVAMALLATKWGWWGAAMKDTPIVGHRWILAVPALMACGIIAGLVTTDWGNLDGGLIVTLAIGCALVGFGEEFVNRGLVLVGARGGMGEFGAWFVSCALFGALHAFNIIVGQSVAATIQQIVFAFVIGSVFYVTRRVTGTLVVAMVLHGFWDFTTIAHTTAAGDDRAGLGGAALQGIFLYVAAILALVVLRRMFRTDPKTGEPLEATAA